MPTDRRRGSHRAERLAIATDTPDAALLEVTTVEKHLLAAPPLSAAATDAGGGNKRERDLQHELDQQKRHNATLQSRLAKVDGSASSSSTELAENEICGLYNSRGGCSYGAKCTKTHVCNYLVRGADGTQRLCGKKHTRFEHK